MKWKPYQTYKPSGVDWLGEIPTHWKVKRLRHLCRINPSKGEVRDLPPSTEVSFLPMDTIGDDGRIDLNEVRTLESVWQGYSYFKDGDVIVAKITPCFENGKGALCKGLLGGVGFGTTELHVLRPQEEVLASFLFSLAKSQPFRNLGIASMQGAAGQQRVTDDFVKDFKFPLPPIGEQELIAAFLDRETAKIDALLAKKERLIELLQEKRAALITHAVTKGLDPSAPMRDSGVEWLGEIPAHWGVTKNRWLFRESDVRSQFGEEELLTVSHITGVTRRSEKPGVTMIEAESHEGYKVCREGELAINTMWAWMGALGIAREDGIVSPSYNVYQFTDTELVTSYYDYLCRIPLQVAEIVRHSKGIWQSRLRLYPDAFREIVTPIPPEDEQRAIGAFLDLETAKINALIDKVRDAIEQLKEHRTTLISAAVTGKIDVRDHVNPEGVAA